MGHFFFLLGFCFLLVHEMDAIRCGEWGILPVTSRMGEEAGYVAFAALHVPIYALLFWGLSGGENLALIAALDAFFVVHAILHVLLRNLPKNHFQSVFSWVLILGAAAFGALDLLAFLFGGAR